MTETDTRTRADIEPILREVVDILVREYQPELIILYGSYAYGTPTRHSDIDLFIVKETTKNRFERNVEAARIVFSPHRNLPVQPLVFTPKELFERKRIGDYFIEDILTKGEVLYRNGKRPKTNARRMVRVR